MTLGHVQHVSTGCLCKLPHVLLVFCGYVFYGYSGVVSVSSRLQTTLLFYYQACLIRELRTEDSKFIGPFSMEICARKAPRLLPPQPQRNLHAPPLNSQASCHQYLSQLLHVLREDEHGAVIRVDVRGQEATRGVPTAVSSGLLGSQYLVGSGHPGSLILWRENTVLHGVDEGRLNVLPADVGDGRASSENRGRHAAEEAVVPVAEGLGQVICVLWGQYLGT